MAQFQYKARRRDGQTVTGILDVADRGAALMQIERLGLFPIAIDTPRGGAAIAAAAAASRPPGTAANWTVDGFPGQPPAGFNTLAQLLVVGMASAEPRSL